MTHIILRSDHCACPNTSIRLPVWIETSHNTPSLHVPTGIYDSSSTDDHSKRYHCSHIHHRKTSIVDGLTPTSRSWIPSLRSKQRLLLRLAKILSSTNFQIPDCRSFRTHVSTTMSVTFLIHHAKRSLVYDSEDSTGVTFKVGS